MALGGLATGVAGVAATAGPVAAFALGLPAALWLASWIGRRHDDQLERVAAALREIGAGRSAPRLVRPRSEGAAHLAGAVEDLSRQMERRLRDAAAEQERLRAVLDGMVEGVLVLDAGGHTLLANQRLRELFDVWGPVAGRPAIEVIRRAEVDDALARAAGPDPVGVELDVGERVVEMHAARFPARGVPLGTVAVFHDVTGIRRLEGMRKDFVANVSHELRTPLTAIRGFAETLLHADPPREQRDRHQAVVVRHAERLAALIDDLLELSRIEAQRTPAEPQPVEVQALCRSVLQDLKPRFVDQGIAWMLAPGPAAHALADRRSLERVLVNLLDNALKYTEAGGEVRVAVARNGGQVRVEVGDTGIGIPSTDLARVFERFYRVDKARSRERGGTGLGLAIVKHLVQAMGGDVGVSSVEGEGTTFEVRLPAIDAADDREPPTA